MEIKSELNDKKENLETYKKIIADKLLLLINGKNISLISSEIGIPTRTINSWTRKKSMPKLKSLLILANYFNCTIDYLVGVKDEFGNKI